MIDIDALRSELDSSRFGIKIAKIKGIENCKIEILEQLKSLGFQMIIARIPSKEIRTIGFLETQGFRIKDIQITYKFSIKSSSINHSFCNPGVLVRDARAEDLSYLLEMATECFQDYGHYFADENLDPARCIEIYQDWTKRALLNSNHNIKFFVAEFNHEVVGYLFLTEEKMKNFTYAVGGIGAVRPQSRGQRVFPTLVHSALGWSKENGHEWQEHNALVYNESVNKAFTNLGFWNSGSEVTLHHWISHDKLHNHPST